MTAIQQKQLHSPDTTGRIFNTRAFVSIMVALTGLSLPVSGLVLHESAHHGHRGGSHEWFTVHIIMGILFTVMMIWHIILNRRPLLHHLKSGRTALWPVSREALLAALVTAALLVMMSLHSH